MATVRFTSNIQRHLPCPEEAVSGGTLAEVLGGYFARHPRVRGYVLDDQGALRNHIVVFVDGLAVKDRSGLADPVAGGAVVDVFQALSGG